MSKNDHFSSLKFLQGGAKSGPKWPKILSKVFFSDSPRKMVVTGPFIEKIDFFDFWPFLDPESRVIYKFLAAQWPQGNHLTPVPPPGNPYLAPTRKYRPKLPSSDRERSKTVKTSENEQKWPFWTQIRYFFDVILAWYYHFRCYRAGQHRQQLGYHVWARHMGHNGHLAAERGQKQWKWAKMSQNRRFGELFINFWLHRGPSGTIWPPYPLKATHI